MADKNPFSEKKSYPLCWPEGWPRQHGFQRSQFGNHSIDRTRILLAQELGRLGVGDWNFILSSNLKLRIDGNPISGQSQPGDKGVAIYFRLKDKPTVMACDKWDRVEHNIYAIYKHIEAIRGQARWGVGNLAQAFRGYQALPAPGQSGGEDPWKVLGLPLNASEEMLKDRYRELAKTIHPDIPKTGDADQWHRIKAAYDMIAQNLRGSA